MAVPMDVYDYDTREQKYRGLKHPSYTNIYELQEELAYRKTLYFQ